MSPIERKWWFALPVMMLAVLATSFLFQIEQVPRSYSLAWFVIFSLCAGGLQRLLSFMTWLLLLWLAPGLVDKRLADPKPSAWSAMRKR
ncbi:hypothetical protein [Janthinobacterium sp. RB2R34]|uniref:hypothetical protein n=1 Tax=Janthinobacterium sp. RB2R34 TaxID=3424193 RepID=UPI003F214F2C